ncbi:MAG: NCS2 family permease [Acidobacteria bacterium]|nr:NCS2 family permease [Acidobacteriota bacterium]MBV9476760.1 NCS2 family permease [Acidobacteriota bacterium]
MAYIIVVNPAILAFAGIPPGPSTVATILTAVFGTLLMGLYANRPIAVAPYMGENAFIAFGLAAFGITWQQRLGAVFLSGLVFLAITLFGVRTWLARAISPSMKHSFAAGIGLFLTFIGLYESGIVKSAQAVPVQLGDVRSAPVLLAIFGFLVIAVLTHRRVPGAILIGIAVTAVAGVLLGEGHAPSHVAALPFTGAYDLSSLAFQLDLNSVLRISFLPILLTLFLMSLLDTLGTLVGLGAAANLLDERGDLPDIEKPMLVDALTCVFSGLVGTSTSGAYIESSTGIREGARTGLASVVTAALFALSLFFIPLFEPMQSLRYAYAPALLIVGMLMLGAVAHIDFDDLTELVPAFATIVMMVFTYNIANGLTAGLMLYPLVKLLGRRARELHAGSIVLALLCALYYLFGLPH